MVQSFNRVLDQVRGCTLCTSHLPMGVRPVVQIHPNAKILIAGQAPGRIVHETGVPFNDESGHRLRDWMGVNSNEFYDPKIIAILPMGFCCPGKGRSGDLAPRPECAETWRSQLIGLMPDIQMTLAIGQYAQAWHLGSKKKSTLTETVKSWQEYWPDILPLPHPSPRNNIWLKKNPWFETDLLPTLKVKVSEIKNLSKFG